MPDVHAPQAADAVQVAFAVAIVDMGPVRLGDDGACAFLFQGRQIGEGVHQMLVEVENFVGKVLAGLLFHVEPYPVVGYLSPVGTTTIWAILTCGGCSRAKRAAAAISSASSTAGKLS